MPWPDDMPEESSYVRRMIDDMHEMSQKLEAAVDGFDRLLRGHNGTEGVLTKLSHVERTAKENKEAIEKMRATVDAFTRGRPDSELSRTKWRVLGEVVVALSAGLALALQFMGG